MFMEEIKTSGSKRIHHQQKESGPHLPQVVKVVLVMNPAVIGRETVGFIGDVLHIQTHTVKELPFEELLRHTHTHARTHTHTHTHTHRDTNTHSHTHTHTYTHTHTVSSASDGAGLEITVDWTWAEPERQGCQRWWRKRSRWGRCFRWASAMWSESPPPASDLELDWSPWGTMKNPVTNTQNHTGPIDSLNLRDTKWL